MAKTKINVATKTTTTDGCTMKRLLFITLLSMPVTSHADALYYTLQTLHAIDCAQTMQIKDHPEIIETNYLLPKNPSAKSVLMFCGVWSGLFYTADKLLSEQNRRELFITAITVKLMVVAGNYRLGIRVGF